MNVYAGHLERMVQGYAELAQIPEAKDYVWERITGLQNGDVVTGETMLGDMQPAFHRNSHAEALYPGLADLVVERAKEIKNAALSK